MQKQPCVLEDAIQSCDALHCITDLLSYSYLLSLTNIWFCPTIEILCNLRNLIQMALGFGYLISLDLLMNWDGIYSSKSLLHKLFCSQLIQNFPKNARFPLPQFATIPDSLIFWLSVCLTQLSLFCLWERPYSCRLRAMIVNCVCEHCCLKENHIAKPLETLFYGMARLKRVLLLPRSYW